MAAFCGFLSIWPHAALRRPVYGWQCFSIQVSFYCTGRVFGIIVVLKNRAAAKQMLSRCYCIQIWQFHSFWQPSIALPLQIATDTNLDSRLQKTCRQRSLVQFLCHLQIVFLTPTERLQQTVDESDACLSVSKGQDFLFVCCRHVFSPAFIYF